jgi:hypothetical protein
VGGRGYSQERAECLTDRGGASKYPGDVRLQVDGDAEFCVASVKLPALAPAAALDMTLGLKVMHGDAAWRAARLRDLRKSL